MRYMVRHALGSSYLMYRSPSGETVTEECSEQNALQLAGEWNRMIDEEFDADKERARIQRQQNQGTI